MAICFRAAMMVRSWRQPRKPWWVSPFWRADAACYRRAKHGPRGPGVLAAAINAALGR
jgi:hypothetical protein